MLCTCCAHTRAWNSNVWPFCCENNNTANNEQRTTKVKRSCWRFYKNALNIIHAQLTQKFLAVLRSKNKNLNTKHRKEENKKSATKPSQEWKKERERVSFQAILGSHNVRLSVSVVFVGAIFYFRILHALWILIPKFNIYVISHSPLKHAHRHFS